MPASQEVGEALPPGRRAPGDGRVMPHAFSAACTFGSAKTLPKPPRKSRLPEGRGDGVTPGVRVKVRREPDGVGTAMPAACRHN